MKPARFSNGKFNFKNSSGPDLAIQAAILINLLDDQSEYAPAEIAAAWRRSEDELLLRIGQCLWALVNSGRPKSKAVGGKDRGAIGHNRKLGASKICVSRQRRLLMANHREILHLMQKVIKKQPQLQGRSSSKRSKKGAKPWLFNPRGMKRALVLCFLILLGAAIPPALDNDVYKILRSDGLEAAFRNMMSLSPKPGTRLYMQSIWLDFRAHDYTAAEKKSLELLDDQRMRPFHADALYCLGQVKAHTGRYFEADAFYRRAIDLYLGDSDPGGNFFLCVLGLAKIRLFMGNYHQAWEALEQASELSRPVEKTRQREAYYDQLKTLVKICLGEYEEAMTFAQERIDICLESGNKDSLIDAYIDMALIQLLLGDDATALGYMTRADLMIVEMADIKRYHHNLTNWLLWQRLSGIQTIAPVKSVIEHRLRETPDPWLFYHLEIAAETPLNGNRKRSRYERDD